MWHSSLIVFKFPPVFPKKRPFTFITQKNIYIISYIHKIFAVDILETRTERGVAGFATKHPSRFQRAFQ